MATITLIGGFGITALKIICGGGGVTLCQNSSGDGSASMQHSGNGHKIISGPGYTTPRLASR